MRRLTLLIAAGIIAPTSLLAAPAPQYSAEELEKSFAKPPATSETKGFTLFTNPSPAKPIAAGAHGTRAHAHHAGPNDAVSAPPPMAGRDLLITFANNSSGLTEQAKANAGEFARALNSPVLADARFAIDGHTNAVGGREANLKLSRDRAGALVDFLVGRGVDRSRLDATGYGFDRPLDPDHPQAAVNRRVEARRVN